MRSLILAACLAATTAVAGPLPRHEGTHFFAYVQCGMLVAAQWMDGDGPHAATTSQMMDPDVLAKVMAARDAAQAEGNAYRVRMEPSGECQRT